MDHEREETGGDEDPIAWGEIDSKRVNLKHARKCLTEALGEEPTPKNLHAYMEEIVSLKEREDCAYAAFRSAVHKILGTQSDKYEICPDIEKYMKESVT